MRQLNLYISPFRLLESLVNEWNLNFWNTINILSRNFYVNCIGLFILIHFLYNHDLFFSNTYIASNIFLFYFVNRSIFKKKLNFLPNKYCELLLKYKINI